MDTVKEIRIHRLRQLCAISIDGSDTVYLDEKALAFLVEYAYRTLEELELEVPFSKSEVGTREYKQAPSLPA